MKPCDNQTAIDVIIALPWPPCNVVGAQKRQCSDCGRDVSIAPSTIRLLKRVGPKPIICILCLPKRVAASGEDELKMFRAPDKEIARDISGDN